MNRTQLIRGLFTSRLKVLDRYATETEAMQRATLARLIKKGRQTLWGWEHGFDKITFYEDFAQLVPVNDYEDLKDYIDRMRHGEKDVLWPGQVRWYAKSSGTTNDKSKFIPITQDALRDTHYQGGKDAVVWYLRNTPHSRLFNGKALILGGSHQPNFNLPHSLVGDLSAILIENINPLVNLIRIPKKTTALLNDFEVKRDRIAHKAIGQRVTNLSGVPSWMLSVLTRVLEISGKEHINEVWPDLEVFWHGGVAFTPYREQYRRIITNPDMHYMETYNASEGFFGLQDDPQDKAMSLRVHTDGRTGENRHHTPTSMGSGDGTQLRDGHHHLKRPVAIYDWRYGALYFTQPLQIRHHGAYEVFHQRLRRGTYRGQCRTGIGDCLSRNGSRSEGIHRSPCLYGRARALPPSMGH